MSASLCLSWEPGIEQDEKRSLCCQLGSVHLVWILIHIITCSPYIVPYSTQSRWIVKKRKIIVLWTLLITVRKTSDWRLKQKFKDTKLPDIISVVCKSEFIIWNKHYSHPMWTAWHGCTCCSWFSNTPPAGQKSLKNAGSCWDCVVVKHQPLWEGRLWGI